MRYFDLPSPSPLNAPCIISTRLLSTIPHHAGLLTLVDILGDHGEHDMLDVLVFVHLRFVQTFVKVRRVVVLIRDTDTDELGHCEDGGGAAAGQNFATLMSSIRDLDTATHCD